eukprot:jgi/Picsp_1/3764/NSC_06599-R1_papain family cysteine protease containing protein
MARLVLVGLFLLAFGLSHHADAINTEPIALPTFSFKSQNEAVAWSKDVLDLKKRYDSKDKKISGPARLQVAELSKAFQEHYDIKWPTDEQQKKLKKFTKNLWYVAETNIENDEEKQPWWTALTLYADYSWFEILSDLLMDIKPIKLDLKPAEITKVFEGIDWKGKGKVTGVKAQGNCGTCWAFAAAAAAESSFLIANDLKYPDWDIDISEQQIVDCARPPTRHPDGTQYFRSTCRVGGYSTEAFRYMTQFNATYEEFYPYRGNIGACTQNPRTENGDTAPGIVISQPYGGFTSVDPRNSTAMKAALGVRPLVQYLRVENGFQFYSGGIYNRACNSRGINHATLVYGYSKVNLGPFSSDSWLVKNSWGTGWGENGFMRLAITPGEGICESQRWVYQPQTVSISIPQ